MEYILQLLLESLLNYYSKLHFITHLYNFGNLGPLLIKPQIKFLKRNGLIECLVSKVIFELFEQFT